MRLGIPPPARPGQALRAALAADKPLVIPGCFNALSARILEEAGFEAMSCRAMAPR